jgi:hypothetical protein
MAAQATFEYGSSGFSIKNPFRLEGLLYIARGLATTALGGLLIFSLRGGIDSQALADPGLAQAVLLVRLVGGALLLAMGLAAFGLGLFKALRFYVGRGAPADLTGPAQSPPVLGEANLAEMLRKRINPLFVEPEGLLARAVHSIFPKLLFMPWPVRNATVRLVTGLVYTALALLLLGIVVFSGSIGLTPIKGDALVNWLSLVAAAFILLIWVRICPRRSDWLTAVTLPKASVWGIVLLVVAAILLPVGFSAVAGNMELPLPPVSAAGWLLWMTVGGVVVTAAGIFMAILRMSDSRSLTEVSEFREHWAESLHPMDIFRAFDMVMADNRYLEIPNREYMTEDARLKLQGSSDKGDFRGESLVEIQPQPTSLNLTGAFTSARAGVLCASHLAAMGAAFWLYMGLSGIRDFSAATISGALVAPLVLWLFATIGVRIANLYLAEVPFQSHLIHFFAEGTYTESKISTGMAITDSTRSENVLVRSNLTPWIFLSALTTSTFAVSGSRNLEQMRYVLDIRKDDPFLRGIVAALRTFIDSRQMIADVRSTSDLQSAGGIHSLNATSRAHATEALPFRPEDVDPSRRNGTRLGFDEDADDDTSNPR